jgi:two-component system, LytTR family, sensor kinase
MKKSYEIVTHVFFWIIFIYLIYYVLDRMGFSFDEQSGIMFLGIHFFGYRFLILLLFGTLIGPFISFYLFNMLLIPKFFIQKRILLFTILALVSSFIIGYSFRLTIGGQGISELRKIITCTILALICGFIGGAFKGFFLWIHSVAEKKELERKHLDSKNALLLLKAQINPHFLFNSLNNIDILIEERPKTASEYLKKLSDILRYVLYETNEGEIELSKEIVQIKNFIELQKIRTDNPHYVSFNLRGDVRDQKIASMIFLPFIENAFKHSRNKTIENAIAIEFEIKDDHIKMNCKNHYEENQLDIIKNEGLGLDTVRQRLNILYPEKHELSINRDDNWFYVTLSIELKNVN